jgi:cyanophycinase
MRIRGCVAALLAALVVLSACDPPSNTDDGLRIIVSSGPVYEVPARDSPPVKPVPQTAGRGTLILEGGGEYVDEASALTVALAGTKPVLCLIDPISPRGSSDAYHKFDGIGGFKMLTINLASNSSQQARVIEALEGCTGYFFNGGDPRMLSIALRPNAEETPALKIIRRRYEQNGAVVAGAGAGAMIAGDLTLCECGPESDVAALVQGNIFEAPGYVFIHGVLIDTHFFARGLLGRHLYALADTKEPVGIGIDDATAVVVPGNGGLWRVLGQGSVALIRRGNAASVKNLQDFSLSILNAGDSFDPVTGRVVVSPKRKSFALPRDPSAAPIETSKVFDPGKILGMIDALAQSPSLLARGYDDGSGMNVQITKRPESSAYSDGTSITILDLDLGITHAQG